VRLCWPPTPGSPAGSYVAGEKLRGGSTEAAAAPARAGRYRSVAGNRRVKEVVIDDATMGTAL